MSVDLTVIIAGQVGGPGGLHTHTPVDWAGNEPGAGAPPAWANKSASQMTAPEGVRPGQNPVLAPNP